MDSNEEEHPDDNNKSCVHAHKDKTEIEIEKSSLFINQTSEEDVVE